MITSKTNRKIFFINFLLGFVLLATSCSLQKEEPPKPWNKTTTLAGFNREFGEPFGVAVKDDVIYVSDGELGKILKIASDGKIENVTDKLNTPSQIAFDQEGSLIVADSGSHTIKKINVQNGEITKLAGVENQSGFADGDAGTALFNAPIGVAVSGQKVYVADTYNDKIRLIENGTVSTIAGSSRGFADDQNGLLAKFDTPSGIAVQQNGNLLVADLGNRRIRLIEQNGATKTFAGSGEANATDGLMSEAEFVAPVSIAVADTGAIYIADGNSIRAVGRRIFPLVETVSGEKRGYSDGVLGTTKFNRPSGLAFDKQGNLLVADAENQTVRIIGHETAGKEISQEQIENLRYKAEEFKQLQPPRWTYDPPTAKRDIAGTLGEIRGEIKEGKNAWFHNGLDIAGNYGETAKFIRAEKVLRPLAVENFGGLRELIRMPTIGYIHIRLGRDQNDKPFGDPRFLFTRGENENFTDLRVPRGAKFTAGETLGTLNRMNHVHLIAGRSGAEMNALAALVFPNISDNVSPTIEKVILSDENWREIETQKPELRIKISAGKYRILVRAFDQMDGNAGYRKLGVYRLGYQILRADKSALTEPDWTISFAELPDESAVPFVYAPGSQSGYTPQTIFDYTVSNKVRKDQIEESFFDITGFGNGEYILRVLAADYFGNISEKELSFEISK